MKKYRVGIIGHTGKGNYGHGLDTVWKSLPDQFEVVGLADANADAVNAAVERTGAAKGYADYLKMLNETKPEILAICPRWIDRHHEYALAAAEHGCHVFMEKPFTPSLEQADELVREFEMRHLKLSIAYQSRYSPIVDVINKLIASGTIGEPLEIRGRGKEDGRGGGEDLWVLGAHVLDLFRAFCGNVATCRADMFENGKPVTKANVKAGNEGLGPLAGDELHAEYTFKDSRIRGYFSSVRNRSGSPSRFGLQIFGSQGIIEVFTNYLTPAWILRDSSWSPGRTGKTWEQISSNGIGKPETLPDVGPHGGNKAAVLDLVAAIEQDRPTHCNIEDARASQEMIIGVFESHRQGGIPVSFPLQNRKHPLAML